MNIKKHPRKIIWSVTAAVAIASASAIHSLNQQSANFDQISSQNVSVSYQSECDPNLWNYVYHPDRLPTKNDCRTVSGTVKWVKHEPDGDYHIRLGLDKQYLCFFRSNECKNLHLAPVNDKNIGGFLVVEPICQTEGMPQPTQADAIQGCAQYVKDNQPQFHMPKVGDHITVTGFYTLDKQHSWMEIHNAIIK